jgi:hypothetical protein
MAAKGEFEWLTDDDTSYIARHLAETWIRYIFHEKMKNGLQQNVIAPTKSRPQAIPMY